MSAAMDCHALATLPASSQHYKSPFLNLQSG